MSSGYGWVLVLKNYSVAALQQDAQSTPKVGDSFSLLLPSVAGQCRAQLFHLLLGVWVPSTWHSVVLDGGDNSNIQSGILAPCPVPDQDICWPAIIARKKKSPLFNRAQACSHSRVK